MLCFALLAASSYGLCRWSVLFSLAPAVSALVTHCVAPWCVALGNDTAPPAGGSMYSACVNTHGGRQKEELLRMLVVLNGHSRAMPETLVTADMGHNIERLHLRLHLHVTFTHVDTQHLFTRATIELAVA